MHECLLLVSGSKGRAKLLRDAGIDFEVVEHSSDEWINVDGLSQDQTVCAIALDKMNSFKFPSHIERRNRVLALAGDTLVFSQDGEVFGKPKDKSDAIRMLRRFRHEPVRVVSGCCLREFRPTFGGKWVTADTKTFVGRAEIFYSIPEYMLEPYFKAEPNYLDVCGGAKIEGFGAQFVKWISGSYTTIQGIPMFELRQELEKLNFFENR